MTDQNFPVSVEVARPDGSVELVRVGTAVRRGDGFVLRLGELTVGGTPERAAYSAPARRAAPAQAQAQGPVDGPVFPNYGRSKGAPIYGASEQDLEFYANGCRRTLNDPSKSRWHDKERQLLAAIEAEQARQRGGSQGDASWGGGGSADEYGYGDEPPPHSDEDAPF